jgi:hypothetical protein
MAGPAQSGVLIYAMNLELVSRFYELVLPAAVLLADAEHRVLQSASCCGCCRWLRDQIFVDYNLELAP